MNRFKQILDNHQEYAREWKKRVGGRILGYFDTYLPEELAYAAGMLPVRMMAEREPDMISAKWIYSSCYPVKSLTNQLLLGRYDYLDALVITEGCQWMYNAFEVAMNNKPDLLTHYLFFPDHTDAPTSKDLLVSELKVFRAKLEEWSGRAIADDALDNAIDVYNTNRRLLRKMYELRRMYRSVILGSEAMTVMLASQLMDKAEMNVWLEEYLRELEEREPYDDRIRLMLLGSETWSVDLEELVESLGANIVVDDLDNGASYCWNETVALKDKDMALALRYLGRPHSALKDNNWRRRPQRIFELAEDFAVDGALIAKQIYCHPHGLDNYAIWKLLRERGIPFHYFERDLTLPREETRLRLNSFFSMIRPGLTRLAGWHTPMTI
ncbi:MAG: 2-hydroxyacyl-CoA dehydratase [Clostridiales bacterium]|nr:2-hydroxyacyl-CoA dehydratase [Clostridiales bacterium]